MICVSKYDRDYYKNRLYDNVCKYCGNNFSGRLHQVLCNDCRGTRKVIDQKVEKAIVCRVCGGVIKIIHTKTKGQFDIYKSRGVCKDCRKAILQNYSDRMKTDSNPAIVKFGRKKVAIKKDKQEIQAMASIRMKQNNPMYNRDIRNKASATFKERVSKGEIKYKHGQEHHLWKGNRDRAQTIRTRLYKEWIKPTLEKYKFKCHICGFTGRLEVHHENESFADVLFRFCPNGLDNLNQEEFELVILEVIEYHKNYVIGIPYCIKHHKEVDSRRR